MNADELKEMAREALKEMRDAALYDGPTHANPKGMKWVEDSYASILEHVNRGPAANPAYTCMGEMAAAVVVLAATDPEGYRKLFSGIFLTKSYEKMGFPEGKLTDLAFMEFFLNSIADDHDFGVDPHGDFPVVRYAHEIDPWVGGINPRNFLDVIRPLVDPAPIPPAP